MSSKLEELLQESVKEIENRKQALLKECEQIEKEIKNKEDDANKRIAHLEEESMKVIAIAAKKSDQALNEAMAIRESLKGSDETLKSVADELNKLDSERQSLFEAKKEFDAYMARENQKLDERAKSLELREAKLDEE